jgi:hypothetical protein
VSAGRPLHLISPAEVDGWLADSVVKVVTYHRTSMLAARLIVERGVDVTRSQFGAYGQGFYTGTEPEPFYGPAQIVAAIRLRSPLLGHIDDIASYVDSLVDELDPLHHRMTPVVARLIRLRLLDAGYDGIVIEDGGGDGIDYVIAMISETVRIVSEV